MPQLALEASKTVIVMCHTSTPKKKLKLNFQIEVMFVIII